jgi:hypothetical protein
MSTFLLDLSGAAAGLPAADFAGAAGVLLGSSWALFQKHRTILLCQALGASCFGAHYLLGSGTAAAACLMSVLQSIAGAGERRPAWLGWFYAATYGVILATAIGAWHGLPSLFAATGAGLSALGRWQREAQRMRLVFLCSSANWVVHNTLVGTPFGLTSDALSLSTILIGLYRNRRRSPGQALRAAISALAERLAPGRAPHAPALSRLA